MHQHNQLPLFYGVKYSGLGQVNLMAVSAQLPLIHPTRILFSLDRVYWEGLVFSKAPMAESRGLQKIRGIQQLGLPAQNYPPITKIVFSPSNPSIVYLCAAVDNSLPGGAGYIYQSVDGGETWQKINGQQNLLGIYQIQNAVLDIDVNPKNPYVVYAAVAAQGIMKTTDGGTDWNTIYAASIVPNEIDYFTFVRASPTDPNTVFFSGYHDILIGAIPLPTEDQVPLEGLLPFPLQKSTDGGSMLDACCRPAASGVVHRYSV